MDQNSKKYLALASTIVTTIALGAYTQSVQWLPELRTVAHFCGAVAVPGFTSFFASNLIYGYEERKNKKLDKKIQVKEEKESIVKEEQQGRRYSINPNIKNKLLKASMMIGSATYIAFCSSWESWQFTQTNIFQLSQYIADISGPLIGMATIGTVDCKALYEKIDKIQEKIFKKKKENEKTFVQEEKELKEEKLPNWDLRQYGETKQSYEEKANTIIQNMPTIERTEERDSLSL